MNEPKNIDKALEELVGYADGLSKAMRLSGLAEDELRDIALNYSIEQCPNCKWFTESTFLIDDDGDEPDGFCENCRPYDKPERD